MYYWSYSLCSRYLNPLKCSGIRWLHLQKWSGKCHPVLTHIFNFWHSGTLTLKAEHQSVRMSTSSSAMAEGPRELDQRFQVGVNLRLNYRLKGYFSRHCDMTQFTLTHHMVNKPFLLLGLAAKYRSRRCNAINVAADHQMFMTLTGELSRQRLRRSAIDFYSKNEKNRSLSHPFWT